MLCESGCQIVDPYIRLRHFQNLLKRAEGTIMARARQHDYLT